MEILKFKLSGKNAFFKKPEVNSYCYFTYGNVHKVALLGIFGAILGYGGYQQMKKGDIWPEFYEKLKETSVSIVPEAKRKGYIPKKVQSFNNSVGYASEEAGGNLIVKQQWLENPQWEIYVKIENAETQKLQAALLQRKSIFIPYLGSNGHPADISEVDMISWKKAEGSQMGRIDSLFLGVEAELDFEEMTDTPPYKYEEYLPVGLQRETNMYQLEKFIYTNLAVKSCKHNLYNANSKTIAFF